MRLTANLLSPVNLALIEKWNPAFSHGKTGKVPL